MERTCTININYFLSPPQKLHIKALEKKPTFKTGVWGLAEINYGQRGIISGSLELHHGECRSQSFWSVGAYFSTTLEKLSPCFLNHAFISPSHTNPTGLWMQTCKFAGLLLSQCTYILVGAAAVKCYLPSNVVGGSILGVYLSVQLLLLRKGEKAMHSLHQIKKKSVIIQRTEMLCGCNHASLHTEPTLAIHLVTPRST